MKKRNIFILFFLFLLLFPFIVIKTIYPFYRFGMFAEKPKTKAHTNYLALQISNKKHTKIMNPSELGFTEGNFQILLRNYYYRNECELFLIKIASLSLEKGTYCIIEKSIENPAFNLSKCCYEKP